MLSGLASQIPFPQSRISPESMATPEQLSSHPVMKRARSAARLLGWTI
jgi:hypothetical protein